ncbi:prephenate dehydratase domain-containing protein [Hymenobacter sp. BT770]|uniref:prephenate dehydratase n=1 Tax=Hymenobacter sp. BT770 TaxID=2886942 RepID=UPI001D12D051|nr:prephenate dehydratase domain-containing protein [Hymenobacter sp. BT770]MCC3154206.1 prephenate dehydratase [Hymenobacter sp. BT770]MDO3414347.1 prephenate dehydratase domain-containing protein [Hymenobacter sp. BT770]
MPKHVSIQGFKGSFHEVAARQYFGAKPDLLPCATFAAVVAHVVNGSAEAGLMAMENSLAGSILPNYLLLERTAVRVTGEVYLPIHQHLLALPGTTLADVQAVHSHPMALRQCGEFLDGHPHWKLVETDDTGHSAQLLAEHRTPGVAVVAGAQAAEQFGLNILAPAIHDDPHNYTRFLVLERAETAQEDPLADKASLYFHAPHAPGSLAQVLTRVASHGLNLSKLQSCPRPGQPWHYGFHADVEFDELAQLNALLHDLVPVTEELRVLGAYRRGHWNTTEIATADAGAATSPKAA